MPKIKTVDARLLVNKHLNGCSHACPCIQAGLHGLLAQAKPGMEHWNPTYAHRRVVAQPTDLTCSFSWGSCIRFVRLQGAAA